jgi:hypothetical protein
MRLYKKTYNLRQICNIAVYMLHSACTIHLLNLPEKTAKRDIIHGVKHLEEIAEDWLCGRRTLSIISVLARKWNVDLPNEAVQVLQRTDERWGTFNTSDVPSPRSNFLVTTTSSSKTTPSPQQRNESQSPASHTLPSPRAPSPPVIPKNSMSPEVLNSAAVSTADFQSQPQLTGQMMSNAAIMGNSIPMDFGRLGSPNWPPASMDDVVPNYSQPYVSFAASGPPRESSQGVSAAQATTPSSVFAVDGHEWYLKDGVNWQAGFNAWNMGSASQPPATLSDQQLFLFAQQSSPNPASPSRVPPTMELSFDSLNALSSIDGWELANLE